MVTKSEKIKTWLSGCGFFHVQDIDTDRLEEGADRIGVYKQAQRDVTEFVDGSKVVNEYYYFLLRQDAQLEHDRRWSNNLMVALEDWIEEQDRIGNLPDVEGIEGVFIANGYYLIDIENDDSVYQVSIGITYHKKGMN